MNLCIRLPWTWLRERAKPAIFLGYRNELQLHVWPSDLDVNGLMNNGCYMTITDLALAGCFALASALSVPLREVWRPMLAAA